MKDSQIEFRAVSKDYRGHSALIHVSFTLQSGDHTAILGSSGSGKSTTLRLLAGLDCPTSGQILLDGKVVSQANQVLLPPHCRRLAMVFQDLALWPNLTVLGNVELGLAGLSLSKKEKSDRCREALTLCAIDSLAARHPSQISVGQQQRVALARALAIQPTYLLLDEPFTGLDLVTKSRLLEEVAGLAGRCKTTIVMVTHDPMEAFFLCQSAIVLSEQGRVEESGSLAGLLQQPRSPLLKIFASRVREMQFSKS